MKNFFSPSIYLQGLKKVRGAGIAMAVTVIITNALVPLTTLFRVMEYMTVEPSVSEVSYSELAPFCALIMLFAPLVTFSMFSYLNDRSKSDFYHSLPQKRGCMFLSFTAAILSWVLATLIVSTLVNTIIWAFVPYYSLSALTVIISLIAYVILAVMMVGFMALAMTLTGTAVANFLIGILLLLFVRVIGVLFVESVSSISNAFLLERSPLSVLYIDFFLPYGILIDVFVNSTKAFTNVWLLIWSAAVAIALIALSTLSYCKRRSEMAGRSAPNKRLQHVYRCAITLPFILLLAYLILDEGLDGYHIVLLAISLLVYMLFELITTKKPIGMVKTLPLFLIPLALGGAFMVGAWATASAIDGVTPTPEEIAGVSIIERSGGYSYEDLLLKDVYIDDSEAARIVSEGLSDTVKGHDRRNYTYSRRLVSVAIELDSGRVIGRRILLSDKERSELYNIIENAEAKDGEYLLLPTDKEITDIYLWGTSSALKGEDTEAIWSSFCKEYAELTDEQKLTVKRMASGTHVAENIDAPSIKSQNYINIAINGQRALEYFYSSYPIIPDLMPKTFMLYIQVYNDNEFDKDPQKKWNELCATVSMASLPKDNGYFQFRIDIEGFTADSEGFSFYSYDGQSPASEELLLTRFKEIIATMSDLNGLTDYTDISSIYKVTVTLDRLTEPQLTPDSYYSEYISQTFYFTLTQDHLNNIGKSFE